VRVSLPRNSHAPRERGRERSAEQVDGRAGHYERKLETKAGEVTLRVPVLCVKETM
jgi:hypothetical protein